MDGGGRDDGAAWGVLVRCGDEVTAVAGASAPRAARRSGAESSGRPRGPVPAADGLARFQEVGRRARANARRSLWEGIGGGRISPSTLSMGSGGGVLDPVAATL